jgi:hypothetical protein
MRGRDRTGEEGGEANRIIGQNHAKEFTTLLMVFLALCVSAPLREIFARSVSSRLAHRSQRSLVTDSVPTAVSS